jgi:hypothetical protein
MSDPSLPARSVPDLPLSGRCFCGAVTFAVAEPPSGVIACHCHDCQQMHGTYNPMAAVPRGALSVSGEALVWFASSAKAQRGFCGRCGSRLFKDNLGSDRVLVSMGSFDGSTGLRLLRNIWTESKGDWYDLPAEEPPRA